MESPFLHFPNLERASRPAQPVAAMPEYTDSPFLAANRLNGRQQGSDKQAEAFVTIMNELHDDEFTEQLEDLLNEAKDLREKSITEGYMNNEQYTRQVMHSYYQPLWREVDGLFDSIIHRSREAGSRQQGLQEVEQLLETYEFNTGDITDVQEQWLGGLKKLAGKAVDAVKKGVSTVGKLASKFGLGFLFNKLKGVVKDFLAGFLQKGINLLPEKYRGMAQTLAGKLAQGEAMDMTPSSEQPSSRDMAEEMQDGINAAAAQLLTADNEAEWGLTEALLESTLESMPEEQGDLLAGARERFVSQLQELEDGQDAGPAVEQFAAVVTTALRFVLPLVGREKVINWMTPLLARLISPFVGKENADALSRLMIDKGFKMLNLESPEGDGSAQAIAETVENTIRQVPGFPAYVLQDRQLFERYMVQAFEKAAAAYLPDVLPDRAYNERPDLRETNERSVMWQQEAQDAPGKVLSEVITAEINPFTAQEIRTFGGIPLSVFLRDRLGINVTSSIPVRVHLFESTAGKDLYQIAKKAAQARGLGSGARQAWMQLHPLTSVAAGLLMREPGLGCKQRHEQCLGKQKSASGHRYYFLEIDGARPQFFQPVNRKPVLRRHTCVKARLNFPASEVQLQLYLGEQDAQAVAASLRKKQPETAHVLLMTALQEGIRNVFSYGKFDYLKITHTRVMPGNRSGMAIDKVPPVLARAFGTALTDWAGKALIAFLREKNVQFIQAAEDHADGVSLQFTLTRPPGFGALGDALSGSLAGIKEDLFAGQPTQIFIQASPGYERR